jgi:hypothetical protein
VGVVALAGIHAVGCDLRVKRKVPWQLVFARGGWNNREPVEQSARHGRCGPVAGRSSQVIGMPMVWAKPVASWMVDHTGIVCRPGCSGLLLRFTGLDWLGVAPFAVFAERPRDALHSRPWRREAFGDWQTFRRPWQACFGPDDRANVAKGPGEGVVLLALMMRLADRTGHPVG